MVSDPRRQRPSRRSTPLGIGIGRSSGVVLRSPVAVDGELPRLALNADYQLVRKLGSGGYGSVYEAIDIALGRSVAIKIPTTDVGVEALRREARALAIVRDPGLVAVYALGTSADRPYLVMELLRGTLLAEHVTVEHLETHGVKSVSEVLELLTALAKTLKVVHASGFAHRDIKPENVMLCPHRVVLLDLGLATPEYAAAEPDASGTPEYMAPEVIRGTLERGRAHLVDVYALGVLAFELLAGRAPFTGSKGARSTLLLHLGPLRPRVSSYRSDIPEALDLFVERMMALSPDDRPESMEVVLWELARLS